MGAGAVAFIRAEPFPPHVVKAHVSTEIRPTEERAKVLRAVTNLFPDAREVASPGKHTAFEAADLGRFAELLRNFRIRDPARSVMMRGRDATGRTTTFSLNKQAAYVGRVNFAEASGPLGDIVVEIEAATPEELELFILEMAPDTAATSFVGDETDAKLRREHEEFMTGVVSSGRPGEEARPDETGRTNRDRPKQHGGTRFEKATKRSRRGQA